MKTRAGMLILFLVAFSFLISCGKTQIDTDPETSEEPTEISVIDSDLLTSTSVPDPEETNFPEASNTATISIETTLTTDQETITSENTTKEELNILQLEEALQELGYAETGLIDGIFDQQTALAIKHLQWLNGMPITGELTPEEYEDLLDGKFQGVMGQPPFSAKSFSMYNTTFMDAGFLSGRLVDLGYLDSADPSFNPFAFDTTTDQALRNFQKSNNLTADGVVDLGVWQALFHPAVVDANGESTINSPDPINDWTSTFFPILNDPIDILFDGQYLWVLHSSGEDAYGNLLLRIDPEDAVFDQPPPIMVGDSEKSENVIVEMIFDGSRIWLLLPHSFDPPELINLIPESGEVLFRTEFADCGYEGCYPAEALGFDGNKVWATMNDRAWAINRSTGDGYLSYEIGWLAQGEMAFDGKCMWMGSEVGLTSFHTGGLTQCPSGNLSYALPSGPVVYDGKRLWVADQVWNALYWLELETGVMGEPVTVGNVPSALAFDGETLWVANAGDNTIQGVDVETGTVGEPIPTGSNPVALAFDGDRLWVANAGDRTLQGIDISNYQIETIYPMETTMPSTTPTPSATPMPTIPAFERSLYLQAVRMKGDDVLIMQQRLLDLGYLEVGEPDGVFGPMTDEAVRHFQENNDLDVDGIVGPVTWEVLFSGDAKGP